MTAKGHRGHADEASVPSTLDFDLVCLSHLRWNLVYQRPQHLLSRCARHRRVFFIEEPIYDAGPARLDITTTEQGVYVIVPYVPEAQIEQNVAVRRMLLEQLMAEYGIAQYVLWYYTPMARSYTRHLSPLATVYDCMDELSAFAGAPPVLREREAELFTQADLVFTGGQSLYEAKRAQHPQVFAFPSSVEVSHFQQARLPQTDPLDQASIAYPRLGFYGVIDERMDLQLLDALAEARPAWQLVLLGPVVKIDPALLPQRPNIHYLGAKSYNELPCYLAGWDAALLPFAINEATRFISPTKTPEYLAAGKPVVSTPIRDVVQPYGVTNLVTIAATPTEWIDALEHILAAVGTPDAIDQQRRADDFLQHISWDRTWAAMEALVEQVVADRARASGRIPMLASTLNRA